MQVQFNLTLSKQAKQRKKEKTCYTFLEEVMWRLFKPFWLKAISTHQPGAASLDIFLEDQRALFDNAQLGVKYVNNVPVSPAPASPDGTSQDVPQSAEHGPKRCEKCRLHPSACGFSYCTSCCCTSLAAYFQDSNLEHRFVPPRYSRCVKDFMRVHVQVWLRLGQGRPFSNPFLSRHSCIFKVIGCVQRCTETQSLYVDSIFEETHCGMSLRSQRLIILWMALCHNLSCYAQMLQAIGRFST